MSQGGGKLMPNLEQKGTKVLNLTVLQRIDPCIQDILFTAAHVSFYEFNIDLNQWSRKDVEGSLFVVKRNSEPWYQFIVMNRRNIENLVENLLGDFKYEIQEPYLLYKNASQEVNGIWFYNARECEEVANVFNRIIESYSRISSKPVVPSQSDFKDEPYVHFCGLTRENNFPNGRIRPGKMADNIEWLAEMMITVAEETVSLFKSPSSTAKRSRHEEEVQPEISRKKGKTSSEGSVPKKTAESALERPEAPPIYLVEEIAPERPSEPPRSEQGEGSGGVSRLDSLFKGVNLAGLHVDDRRELTVKFMKALPFADDAKRLEGHLPELFRNMADHVLMVTLFTKMFEQHLSFMKEKQKVAEEKGRGLKEKIKALTQKNAQMADKLKEVEAKLQAERDTAALRTNTLKKDVGILNKKLKTANAATAAARKIAGDTFRMATQNGVRALERVISRFGITADLVQVRDFYVDQVRTLINQQSEGLQVQAQAKQTNQPPPPSHAITTIECVKDVRLDQAKSVSQSKPTLTLNSPPRNIKFKYPNPP